MFVEMVFLAEFCVCLGKGSPLLSSPQSLFKELPKGWVAPQDVAHEYFHILGKTPEGRRLAPLVSGLTEHNVMVGSLKRMYKIYIQNPDTSIQQQGLIMMLHGMGQPIDSFWYTGDYRSNTAKLGWVSVFPQGWTADEGGSDRSWYSGWCCHTDNAVVDDKSFIKEVMAIIRNTFQLDIPEGRTFLSGYSAGCYLAFAISCDPTTATDFDAYGGLACVWQSDRNREYYDSCAPTKPFFYATMTEDAYTVQADATWTRYTTRLQCPGEAKQSFSSGIVTCFDKINCGATLVSTRHCKLQGLPHHPMPFASNEAGWEFSLEQWNWWTDVVEANVTGLVDPNTAPTKSLFLCFFLAALSLHMVI